MMCTVYTHRIKLVPFPKISNTPLTNFKTKKKKNSYDFEQHNYSVLNFNALNYKIIQTERFYKLLSGGTNIVPWVYTIYILGRTPPFHLQY